MILRHLKRIGFLGFILLTLEIGDLQAQNNEEEDIIRSLRLASNAAIAAHDAQGIGSFLDEDFIISISTGAIEHSHKEHIKSFEEHFQEFPNVVYIRIPIDITISSSHPLAFEHGTWVGTRRGLEFGGHYSAGWRKIDGVWKIHSELFVALYCKGPNC